MIERLIDSLKAYLQTAEGRMVSLRDIREFLKIEPGSKDDQNLRVLMSVNLVRDKIVSPSGKSDGYYKVIKQVKPVTVFGRDRRPPIELKFPRDFDTGMEMSFAEDVILREGDAILIAGQSNYGKTCIGLNICGENINSNPVLMGNEYTGIDGEPSSRFLNRLDAMDWVEWFDSEGDRFTLLPVREDYAEHIIPGRHTIIDWINLDEHYLISKIMENCKKAVGRAVLIAIIQKSPDSTMGRGAQFTKDFADLEILLDNFGEDEVLLTLGKVKEAKRRLTGKTYAFYIGKGIKIQNFREVQKCPTCYGKGWKNGKPCDDCFQKGYIDK